MKLQKHWWTKNEVKKLLELWESKTLEDISTEFNLRPSQISYIVNNMRKVGIKMARKHRSGQLRTMLLEIKAEMR